MAAAVAMTSHPFISYLESSLALCHPNADRDTVLPLYNGPASPQMHNILSMLSDIVRRMHSAEDEVEALRTGQAWPTSRPDSKKRRRVSAMVRATPSRWPFAVNVHGI